MTVGTSKWCNCSGDNWVLCILSLIDLKMNFRKEGSPPEDSCSI